MISPVLRAIYYVVLRNGASHNINGDHEADHIINEALDDAPWGDKDWEDKWSVIALKGLMKKLI
jgi:hypothetical protein